jgi:hypothetical protein
VPYTVTRNRSTGPHQSDEFAAQRRANAIFKWQRAYNVVACTKSWEKLALISKLTPEAS